MIAYFFHFCQSDFRDLWGHGEVGWLAAEKSAGRQRILATSPICVAFLPCSAAGRQRISATSPIYVALTPTPLKTKFFAKPIVTPPLVWYNTGYHRIVIQGIIVCFQACLHGWGTSFETRTNMRMQHCGAEFECLQDCERRFATEQSVVL